MNIEVFIDNNARRFTLPEYCVIGKQLKNFVLSHLNDDIVFSDLTLFLSNENKLTPFADDEEIFDEDIFYIEIL